MKALIFAAGLGTRLQPLTLDKPKALVPLCGTPMLEHQLRHLYFSGFEDIVINVHAFGEQIESFVPDFLNRFHNEYPQNNLTISISKEYDLLRDTGGGVLHAQQLLGNEPFLVHNVDIFSNLDLKTFYTDSLALFESNSKIVANIVVSNRETERYFLFNRDNILVGWENRKSGEVRSLYKEYSQKSVDELDRIGLRHLPFAGIHIMSPKIFSLLRSYSKGIESNSFSIVDFYLNISRKWDIVGNVVEDLKICDVGKIEHIAQAERFVREL